LDDETTKANARRSDSDRLTSKKTERLKSKFQLRIIQNINKLRHQLPASDVIIILVPVIIIIKIINSAENTLLSPEKDNQTENSVCLLLLRNLD